MRKILINPGDKYNKHTVLRELEPRLYPSGRVARIVDTQCECGEICHAIEINDLRQNKSKSCGCDKRKSPIFTPGRGKHGHTSKNSTSPEYYSWKNMKYRCNNPNANRWKSYGGRGIKVCDEWSNSFATFLKDMGPRPSPRHSLDRIDVNGMYEPSNCKWSTHKEQNNNRQRHVTNISK